jgi:hypothetical protein
LRQAFESGDLTGALAEASAELATIGLIDDAAASQPRSAGVLEAVGLLGAAPAAELQAGREQFASGDLTTAARSVVLARSDWTSATDVGRGRVVSAIALALALILFAGLIVGRRRRSSAAREGLHSAP